MKLAHGADADYFMRSGATISLIMTPFQISRRIALMIKNECEISIDKAGKTELSLTVKTVRESQFPILIWTSTHLSRSAGPSDFW